MFRNGHTQQAPAHESGDRRNTMVAVVTLAVAAMLLMPGMTPQAHAVDLLPDLVAEPPNNAQPARLEVLGDGYSHLLIRFNGRIHNIGPGPIEIRGSNPVNGTMAVTAQRIYRQDSTFYDDHSRPRQIHFENTDGHDHWHLMGAARFSLWNQAGTAQLVPASKVGFCLEDGDPIDSFASPTPAYSEAQIQRCKEGQPNASSVFQGISSGWEDVYGANLPFQWIDVTNVAPGLYRLGAEMDPNDYMLEGNEANNGPTLATSSVTVPGYVASPRATETSVAKPRTIPLGALQYGTPGPRRFRIESGPKHGRLSSATGAFFSGPRVRYKPKRGFRGSDSFTFSARDASSPFPVRSPVATVTVRVSRVLSGLRFAHQGRILFVRGRATRSGLLRFQIKKAGRRLGSCRARARAQRRFRCTVRLRGLASPARAKAIASLRTPGKPKVVNTFRVPRKLPSR